MTKRICILTLRSGRCTNHSSKAIKEKSLSLFDISIVCWNPLEGDKAAGGITMTDSDRDDKGSIAFLTPAASRCLRRKQGLHLSCSAPPGQVAGCQAAINLFFNLTFSPASPLGWLHKQGKHGEPHCDYYDRKKFRG